LVSVLPMRCRVDKFLSCANADVATIAETAKVTAEIFRKLTRYSLWKKKACEHDHGAAVN